jgi:hypothetical protein
VKNFSIDLEHISQAGNTISEETIWQFSKKMFKNYFIKKRK